MTAAGVACLGALRAVLEDPAAPRDDPALERGLAWLAARFSVTRNAASPGRGARRQRRRKAGRG